MASSDSLVQSCRIILSFTKNVQKMLFSWAGKGILLFWLSKRHLRASYIYTEWRAINLKGVSPSFIAVILSLCPTPKGWPCFRFACCLYCHFSCAASARKERKASIYRWQQLNYLQTVVSSGHFSSLSRSVIFSSTGCFFFSQPKFLLGMQREPLRNDFPGLSHTLRLHGAAIVPFFQIPPSSTAAGTRPQPQAHTVTCNTFLSPKMAEASHIFPLYNLWNLWNESIAPNILHWCWYRWTRLPSASSQHPTVLTYQTLDWSNWRGGN